MAQRKSAQRKYFEEEEENDVERKNEFKQNEHLDFKNNVISTLKSSPKRGSNMRSNSPNRIRKKSPVKKQNYETGEEEYEYEYEYAEEEDGEEEEEEERYEAPQPVYRRSSMRRRSPPRNRPTTSMSDSRRTRQQQSSDNEYNSDMKRKSSYLSYENDNGSQENFGEHDYDQHDSSSKNESTMRRQKSNQNQNDSKQPRQRNIPRLSLPPKTKEEQFKDARIKAYDDLVERQKKPPPNLIIPVQRMLQRQYLIALQNEDYDKGAKLDKALQINGKIMEEQLDTERRKMQAESLQYRIKHARQELDKKNKEWEDILAQNKKEQAKARQELLQKHQEEEAEFAKLWGDPQNLMEFNKPSPQLLTLRRMQKQLAMARFFDDAKKVKEQGDALQKQEERAAEMRALDAMLLAHNKLKERQRKELLCFDEKEKRTELYLNGEKYSECHPIEMQIKQLQYTIDSEKPKNLKPMKYAFQSTIRTRSSMSEKAAMPSKDAATATAYNKFRANDEPAKLNINGLDVRTIMKRPASLIRVVQRRQ